MKTKLIIALGVFSVALLAVLGTNREGHSQGAKGSLTIAIYTPTVAFATSAARLAYVQGLAKAVESNVGTKVTGKSFTSLAQLTRAKPDFAIVSSQCYAAKPEWNLLANATVKGAAVSKWALYSSVGPKMQGLKGKKLAFVKMGCRDKDFLANAMLESEVDMSFFSSQVGKPDMAGAVAEVATYKGAQAVFAPVGSQKGLTKVFDTGSVPNPAFVQVNKKLSKSVVDSVGRAVIGFGGGGAISGWKASDADAFRSLRTRLSKRVKRGVFAPPSPVRVDAKDILIEPETLGDTRLTEIKQHFNKPPERQQ